MLGLCSAPASAQLNGQNLLGDFGVGSGTQPAPGFYAVVLYYRYDTDTIRNRDGDRLVIDPGQPATEALHAVAPFVIFVSTKKVLGANIGMMAGLPFANGSLEAPAFGLEADIDTGVGDAYIAQLTLGWHMKRADVNAGFAFFPPTGRYTVGAPDNIGKNMWSYELSGGTTVHLDAARKWNLATAAFWELHGDKRGSRGLVVGPITLTEVRVGQLLTLEGGVGRAFLGGAANIGAAYYAQWKLTHDDFGLPSTTPALIGKHRVFGFGPDVTIPIATKSSLISLVNVRYFWETGSPDHPSR